MKVHNFVERESVAKQAYLTINVRLD